MSYWCGYEKTKINSINMTSNVAPMWREAGADLAELDGKEAKEVLPILAEAVKNMLLDQEKYRAMNPSNGWGDFEGCLAYLCELAFMSGTVDPSDKFYAHY